MANSQVSAVTNNSWIKIDNNIINCGIGGAGQIWGVNAKNQIYYKPDLDHDWEKIDGELSYISVGAAGHVFGVDNNDDIFYRTCASNYNQKGSGWTKTNGKLVQVAVTSYGGVWGIDRANKVFYRAEPQGEWEQLDDLLKHISVGANGEVWGVNASDQIVYREGSSNTNPKGNCWRQINGALKCLAVGGNGQVWGVDSDDRIWFRPNVDTDWVQVEGNLSFVSVAPNGLVFGYDKNGNIFHRQGYHTTVTFPEGISVVGDPKPQCVVRSDNVLEIHTHGAPGGVSIAFEQLNLPSVKSLSNQVLEFDLEFLVKPGGDIGRHGGIFYGNNQFNRRTKGRTCLDWIDRAHDRGYRFYETGPNHGSNLNVLLPRGKEPINHLKIIIKDNGEQILVAGDDIWRVHNVGSVHLMDKPCIGFWAWHSNQIRISNFVVRPYTGCELG